MILLLSRTYRLQSLEELKITSSYFAQFPQITYANNLVVDITERVVVRSAPLRAPYVYYPLSLVPYVRPDQVAYSVWGDPYLSWILYLTNNIVDPYYDWYLPQDQFDSYVATKYGSIANAMNTIAFYVNDWVDVPDITVARYDALTSNQQTFWTPNYGYYSQPTSYSRLQTDWYASTNYVLGLGITGNTTAFSQNEPLYISYDPPSNNGAAQFVQGNSSFVFVQHVSGAAFPNSSTGVTIGPSSYVRGTSSGANARVTSCSFLSNNINADLVDYYAPVYYYDLESEWNAGNRFVNVLNPQYQPGFCSTVQNLLSNVSPAVITT